MAGPSPALVFWALQQWGWTLCSLKICLIWKCQISVVSLHLEPPCGRCLCTPLWSRCQVLPGTHSAPFLLVLGVSLVQPAECGVHLCKAEVCEACLVLLGLWGEAGIGGSGTSQSSDSWAYYVRAAVAYRMGPWKSRRDDFKFSHMMRLKYQASPSPKENTGVQQGEMTCRALWLCVGSLTSNSKSGLWGYFFRH